MRRQETICALGAGVIGASWAALLLAAGEALEKVAAERDALIVELLRGRRALAAQH
jgi:3-hydroxyacyl-CoA dehydrogenase